MRRLHGKASQFCRLRCLSERIEGAILSDSALLACAEERRFRYAVAEATRAFAGVTKPERSWSSRRAWTMAQRTSVGWQGEAIRSKAP